MHITPDMKAKLQRKNRLMPAGRVEEAGALAEHIGKDLKRLNKNRFKTINGKTDVKDIWAAVRQLTGRKKGTGTVAGITAESLNSHYVAERRQSIYNLLFPLSFNAFLHGESSRS
jgi:hypothetical protein